MPVFPMGSSDTLSEVADFGAFFERTLEKRRPVFSCTKNHMKSFVEEVADVDGGPPKAIDTTSSLEINGGDS